ncbi:MAG: response regulator [Candidatus Xenobia bacterium]
MERKTEAPLILIIDDNKQNVQLLKVCLESKDYRTLVAYDGEEGIRLAVDARPDLILLDVMLPGMDGFEVCRRLKSMNHVPFVPIIMITALSEPQDKIRGLEEGADDYLSKPFDRLELYSRVKNLVRLKRTLEDQIALRKRLEVEEKTRELLKQFVNAFSGGIFHMVEESELHGLMQIGQEIASQDIEHADQIGRARALTEEKLLELGMDRDRVFDMVLCVSEATTNALKHGEGGSMSIHKSGEDVQVWIADHGCGIDMDLLAKSTLMKGFSTKMTLGYGFTILRELLDRVYLNTSPRGTTVGLQMNINGHSAEVYQAVRLFPSLAENV